MKTQLQSQLLEWNQKQVQYLTNIYHENVNNEDFWEYILELFLEDNKLEFATTWLMKHHYDNGYSLQEKQIISIYQHADQVEFWQAKLHLLQLVEMIQIPNVVLNEIDLFARKNFKEQQPFIKAFALYSLFILSKQIPEYRAEVREMCQLVLEEGKASTKARARKVIRELNKLEK